MSKPEKRHYVKSAGRENLDAEHASQYDVKEDASVMEELALMKRLGLNGQIVSRAFLLLRHPLIAT